MVAERRGIRAGFHELSLARAFLVALLIEALLAAAMTVYFPGPAPPPAARSVPLVVTLEDLVAGRTEARALEAAPVAGPRPAQETPRHRGRRPKTIMNPVPEQRPVVPPKRLAAPVPRLRAERKSARHRARRPKAKLSPAPKRRPAALPERASPPARRSSRKADLPHRHTPSPARTAEVAPQSTQPPRDVPRPIPAAKGKRAPSDSRSEPRPTNPPRPSSAQVPTPRMTDAFRSAVRGAVQRAVRYPPDAQLMGEEGAVEVAFDFRNGRSENVRITRSSDSALLDEAALWTVRNARLPRAPEALRRRVLHFRIWIRFRLQADD